MVDVHLDRVVEDFWRWVVEENGIHLVDSNGRKEEVGKHRSVVELAWGSSWDEDTKTFNRKPLSVLILHH